MGPLCCTSKEQLIMLFEGYKMFATFQNKVYINVDLCGLINREQVSEIKGSING